MSRLPANVSRFTFEIIGQPETYKVLSFKGREALSSLFDYRIEVSCEDGDLSLVGLLGKTAVLTLVDAAHPRVIHGMVFSVQQLDRGERFSRYCFRLAPKLAGLQLRSGHRIFQQQKPSEVVATLLKEAGLQDSEIRWQLQSQEPQRDYIVQYGETEYQFIHRLLVDEGIHFFFEHTLDCHRLVLSDNNQVFGAIAGESVVRYCQEERTAKDEPTISALSYQQAISVSCATLADFNFAKPNLKLRSQPNHGPETAVGRLEAYQYATTPSDTEAVINRYQKLHQERYRCRDETIHFTSDDVRLFVGARFAVKEHPNPKLNQEYLLYDYELEGRLPQSQEALSSGDASLFICKGNAMPVATVYRPAPAFEAPTIKGIQTAFVTGPKDNEIYTDKFGRIKVQFHWDRQGQRDEATSCWVRVSQALAGKEWGSWVLPRVGQEVIVAFEQGDPARPLVTGCVYNGLNNPPYALPKFKARSGLKSRSAEKGSGFNELRIDDKKGQEKLFLRAEKNLDIRVKGDRKTHIGNEQHTSVGKNVYQSVTKDSHIDVGKDQAIDVGQSLSFNVGKDLHLKVSGAEVTQAGNQVHIKGGMKTVLQAGMQLALKVGGSFVSLDPSGVSITGPIVRINEGGSAGSAQGASPASPQAPTQPDDDNTGKLSKTPPPEDPNVPYPLKFHRGKAQAYIYKTAAQERVAFLEAANADADKSVESADSVAGSGSAGTDNATDSHTGPNNPMDAMAGGFHDQASGNKLADDVERGENSGTMLVGGVDGVPDNNQLSIGAGRKDGESLFNPTGSGDNCVNGVCAFLNTMETGTLHTASPHVAVNGGSIPVALKQIAEQTGAKVGGKSSAQFSTLNTARDRQFFVVFQGPDFEVSNHVAVGIVNKGNKVIFDPQTGVTYKNLSDWNKKGGGSFTSFPLLLNKQQKQ